MIESKVIQVLLGVVLASVLTFLYIKTQTADTLAHSHITDNLRHIKEVNANLNKDILKARNELLLHYDTIVDGLKLVDKLYQSFITGKYSIYNKGRDSIDNRLDNIGTLLNEKVQTIEKFKSVNSIVRNSVHYLPHLADSLIQDFVAQKIETKHITEITDMLSDTLSYSITGDATFRFHVDAHTIYLLNNLEHYPAEHHGDLISLIKHTKIVVEQKPVVDNLLATIVAIPLPDRLNELIQDYNLYNFNRAKTIDVYRLYLYVFAVLMLFYIIFIMSRLRKNALTLNKVVKDLNYQKFALDQHAIVSIADDNGKLLYVNDKYSEVSGYSKKELLAFVHRQVFVNVNDDDTYSELWPVISSGRVWQGEICNQKKDGSHYWLHSTIVPFVDDSGKPYQYVSIHTDISGQKNSEKALFNAKEQAQVTLSSIGDGVLTTDNVGAINYLNPTAEVITGWTNKEALGLDLLKVLKLVEDSTRERISNPIAPCLEEEKTVNLSMPITLLRNDGKEFAIEITASPIMDDFRHVSGAVIVLRDVSEVRGLARKMSYQAAHDSLTGLMNRREFERRLKQSLSSAKKYFHEHALCYLDLDQFKLVNDTCGHIAGDELLRQLSVVLKGKVRDRDTLARLGGDEFGILINDCPIDQANRIAQEICQEIKDFHFIWQDKTFDLGASIGLVAINSNSDGLARVLSIADSACYEAKDKGRNRVHVYQEDDVELQKRHGEMQWVPRIAKALTEDRFILYSQLISPMNTDAKDEAHFEVLIRLVDEDGDIVPPGAFMPAAERYNIMPTIDRWVIKKVFSLLQKAYRNDKYPLEMCAINLSGASLNDDSLLDFIQDQFKIYNIPQRAICFEITETVAISNLSAAHEFIRELKAIGCHFALDDFGSGLSSFRYLKNLPVDYLKIDGSFVKDIVDDPISFSMVESINQIGHVMGLKTIAEYAENKSITKKIRSIGVDYAQGIGIHSPEPLYEWLEKKVSNKLTLVK